MQGTRVTYPTGGNYRVGGSRLLLEDKVSIGLIEGPARQREVRTEPFMEDKLVLIASPDFEFERLSRDQLTASTLLLRERGSGSRNVADMALEKAGLKVKSFKNVIELDSTEAIKSAVEAGLGIGFVSCWALLQGDGIASTQAH